MPTIDEPPDAVVHRAAMIARGPYACPHCECPTWTEPPVPWTGLRDYVVRCDWCARPICVRVDRARVLRRGAAPSHVRGALPRDTVTELLDSRGRRAFASRLLVALAAPLLVGSAAHSTGASTALSFSLALLLVVPSALWAPALIATGWDWLIARAVDATDALRRLARRAPRQGAVVDVAPGRWDQWQRERSVRDRDRAEHPDALLRELERVLDDRELRRVRRLARRGDAPADWLDDLLALRHGSEHRPMAGIEGRLAG